METTPSSGLFSQFPEEYAGLVLVAAGLLLLLGAIRDWDWVLEGNGSRMNAAWISNTFGRKTARIFVGICGSIIALSGLVLFLLRHT